jgi:hypothetical protein
MATHRSAMGRSVDMSQIVARNERVRAVGNMKVNARGDSIDSQGRIISPMTQKAGQRYQNTVNNRTANELNQGLQRRPNPQPVDNVPPAPVAAPVPIPVDELLANELELEDDAEAAEIESIKSAEAKKKVVIKPASEAPDFFKPEPKKTK